MSDPNNQQDQATLAVLVTVLSALLVGKVVDETLDLLKRFAAVFKTFGAAPAALSKVRQEAYTVAVRLQEEIPGLSAQVVDEAVRAGAGSAGDGLPASFKLGFDTSGGFETHADRSARAIREDLAGKLNQLTYRITRFADDAYRAVVADAATAQVQGLTPAGTQGEAYRKLTRAGITGYTDSKGRNWELSAYVEMATRTAAQRAYNVAHLDRMQTFGIDLFTVTDDGHPCPLCQPWQGKILSVATDPRADATIAEATAAGLFHPRCRHTLVAFIPGRTSIPAPRPWTSADEAAYEASQRQRLLERRIRAAKREQAAAFTPEQTARANRSVRQAQAAMREFIAQTGRVRNTRREQLNLGAKA